MRFRALLIAGLLTAAQGLSAQTAESPAVFDSREWDFGAILEADGVVTHAFLVFNAGSRPLRLTRAVPGCSCISATLPRTAIAPGQSAAVEVGPLLMAFRPKEDWELLTERTYCSDWQVTTQEAWNWALVEDGELVCR